MLDMHWYTDDEVNFLLSKLLENDKDVEILTAMMGNQWSQDKDLNNTLKDNLADFHKKRLPTDSKKKVVVPINMGTQKGEGIHWDIIFVLYDDKSQAQQVVYVDPYGASISPEVENSLCNAFGIDKQKILSVPIKFQNDGWNCGPWVVEIAKSWVQTDHFPAENHGIENARNEHTKIIKQFKPALRINTSPTPASSHALHKPHKERFSPTQIKAALNEIFKNESISYDETSKRVKARIEDNGKVFNFEQKERYCELTTLSNNDKVLDLMVEKTAAILTKLGLPPQIEIQAPNDEIKKILLSACARHGLTEKNSSLLNTSASP